MKDKLAKQQHNANNAAATTTKMTTEKKGENKAGAASTPPSPSPPPVAVVIKGGKNATTSLSPTGTLRGYWQAEEETALRAAVQKHGIGAWEKMRTDPDFKALRCARYIFYRERRATDCFSSRFFQVLLVVFVFSFSRFLVVVFVLCAVMMRETQTRQFQFPATRGGRAGDKKTKKLSSSSSFAMKFPQNVLWEHFFPNNNNTVSSLSSSSSSSSSSRLSKKFVFRDGEEEVKEEEVKEESCCCCCWCVFECGSFRWLGDLVVVVVKVESSSVASNLSQKTTFKINAGLSSFTFPKFQGKNRSAAER